MAGSSRDPQMNHLHREFYAKFMQVILESRIYTSTSSHSEDGCASTGCAPAFNLVLGKFGGLMDTMEPWCKGIQEPMVIDIFCSRRGNDRVVKGLVQKVGKGAGNLHEKAPAGLAFAKPGLEQPILLERWTVEFRPYRSQSLSKVERESSLQVQKEMFGAQNYKWGVGPLEYFYRGGSSGKNESVTAYNLVEKKMAILLRTLYSTARLLPAQNFCRLLSTSGHSKLKMFHTVTTELSGSNRKDMTYFHFTPIETHHGLLQVSVAYRQKVPSTKREKYAICPEIIHDYIGRASFQSKNLLADKAGQAHSLPLSAQRLSSFKFENLQLHQLPSKGMGAKNLDRANTVAVGGSNFSFIEDLDCPFAIHEEQADKRMEKAKLRSVKSDAEGYREHATHALGGPLEAFQAFQSPAVLMHGVSQQKKDAASALKELKMYIDLKERLLK